MRVLVTGAASPRGRQVATHLLNAGHEVTGVDTEVWRIPPPKLRIENLDHRKRGFEELMRNLKLDAVVHMAVHAGFRLSSAQRHRLNIEGTNRIIGLVAKHQVGKLIMASHAAVYGALADNPYYMTEDAPPAVGRTFPEMQDLVTADLLAGAAMWKHPKVELVVLRLVHALGPTSRGAMAQLLKRRRVPTVAGFDPLVQVIHELDVPAAFASSLDKGVRGVFNVTGPGELPLSVLIKESGAKRLPVPGPIFARLPGKFGLPKAAAAVMDFVKHPCLVDGARFRQQTGYEPAHTLRDTARAMRQS